MAIPTATTPTSPSSPGGSLPATETLPLRTDREGLTQALAFTEAHRRLAHVSTPAREAACLAAPFPAILLPIEDGDLLAGVGAEVRGVVFDIQRTAMHDGPDIRTAVFLKGCPLRCEWCHNPESWPAAPELSFEPEACTRCDDCVPVCPNEAHQPGDGRHVFLRDRCQACGKCVEACDTGALALVGSEMTVAGVMDVVERDRAFYERSGGGLTVSGGEPLAQASFTLALFATAKGRGIHTCLDTSGAGGAADLEG